DDPLLPGPARLRSEGQPAEHAEVRGGSFRVELDEQGGRDGRGGQSLSLHPVRPVRPVRLTALPPRSHSPPATSPRWENPPASPGGNQIRHLWTFAGPPPGPSRSGRSSACLGPRAGPESGDRPRG